MAIDVSRPSPAVLARAAEWAATLDDDRVSAEQHQACQAWCAESPQHRLAFDRMRGVDGQLQGLDTPARAVLGAAARAPARRSRTTAALVGLALAGLGVLAAQSPYVRQAFPDHRTTVGEQRTITLADGSDLVLDSASAVDVTTARAARTVRLYRGQVMATVAADPARPFTIKTAEGSATALGTAFSVRRDADSAVVTVVESVVQVCPRTTPEVCVRLKAGERARLTPSRVTRMSPVDPDAASAWAKGWLEANDTPLHDVLAELNRYRERPIRFDAAALRSVRVTGSYPLTDAERALAAIASTASLRVSHAQDGAVVVARR